MSIVKGFRNPQFDQFAYPIESNRKTNEIPNILKHLNQRQLGTSFARRIMCFRCRVGSQLPTPTKSSFKKVLDWSAELLDGSPECLCSESYVKHGNLGQILHKKLPASFIEQQYQTTGLDKIFTSAWLSETDIVFGTKCNQIVVLNVASNKKVVIPTCHTPQATPPAPSHQLSQQCSGIHSLAINDSQTMLAVGYGNSSENIQIYRLPYFELVAMLRGHTDMVFSIKWIDNNTLVSGSRDRKVKIWKVPDLWPNEDFDLPSIGCITSKCEHRDKVRDLALDHHHGLLYSLSADSTVKIWDIERNFGEGVKKVPLVHPNETVCLALDKESHLVSVGSQSHISLIDHRSSSIVHIFESMDEGWGVRSMDINHGVVTVGGGLGKISFYDLKAQKYLSWECTTDITNPPTNFLSTICKNTSLKTGQGWLHHDNIYLNHFQGLDIRNAVYTCQYSPSGTRLFCAGGPLQLNLRGSYAGLWQ